MAQFGWCSLKLSRRLSTHIHLQINKINSISQISFRFSKRLLLAAKFALGRTLLSDEMVPSIVAEDGIVLRVYCWLAENQASLLWQMVVRLLWFYLGTRGFRKMLWRLPPIHFGKEDGVERTLLRVACQSEPFLASPWHGGASIRFLWHIGCQSEFDELVSLASRMVDCGSCRTGT